jgi:RNA polymerase sigma factor (sigma-70 family)
LKKEGTPTGWAGGASADVPLHVLARSAQSAGGAARELFSRRARERVVDAVRDQISRRLAKQAGFDDVVQDVMLRVARGLAGFKVRDEASIHAWILTLVRNRVRDLYDYYEVAKKRDSSRDTSLSDLRREEQDGDLSAAGTSDARSLPDALHERDLTERAVAAIRRLPPDEALVVRRIELEGEPVSAVARERGVHESTIRIWLGHGLARVAQLMGEESGERTGRSRPG